MTLSSILAETKSLVPDLERMSVTCILKSGKKVDVKVEEHLDFFKEYETMKRRVYGEKTKYVKSGDFEEIVNKAYEKMKKSKQRDKRAMMIRNVATNETFATSLEFAESLGYLRSSSSSLVRKIRSGKLIKGQKFEIISESPRYRKSKNIIKFNNQQDWLS